MHLSRPSVWAAWSLLVLARRVFMQIWSRESRVHPSLCDTPSRRSRAVVSEHTQRLLLTHTSSERQSVDAWGSLRGKGHPQEILGDGISPSHTEGPCSWWHYSMGSPSYSEPYCGFFFIFCRHIFRCLHIFLFITTRISRVATFWQVTFPFHLYLFYILFLMW